MKQPSTMHSTCIKKASKNNEQIKQHFSVDKSSQTGAWSMVEKGLQISRRSVRFAAEGSLNEINQKIKEQRLRETGDQTRLEA